LQVNDTVTIVDGGNVDMSGNYAVSKQGTTGTITAKELTFAAVSDSKVYDGGTSSTKAAIITGKQGDDTITAVQAFASKNVLGAADSTLEVGAVSINDGNDGKNYSIGNKANGNGTISKADLTVTLADQTKTYDGTTAATLVPKAFTVKGVTVAGQTETASVHQTVALYNDKNVLGASSITANLAADNFAAAIGTDLNNYNLPTSVIGKGKITPKDAAVTGTATTVQANGTQQTQSPPTKSGFVAGEDVTVSGVATGMIAGTYNSNLSAAPANAATVLSNYKMAYTNAPLQITPGIVTNSNLAAAVAVALARPPTPTSRVNLLGFFNTSGVAAAMPGGAGGAKSGRLGAAMPGGVDAGAAIKAPSGAVVSPQQACSPENLQQCACKESGGDGIELCLAPDDKL
jgi:hypothetical protein